MSNIHLLPSRVGRAFINAAEGSNGIKALILAARPDYHAVVTHFLGDALPAEWAAAKTNGTAAANTVASSFLTMTSGTDDDGYAGQGFGLFWKGDNGMYLYSAQALDTLATSKIEIGITDAVDDAGAVATKATPTDTADDFTVLVRDTDDNTELDIISTLDNGTCTANAENVHTVAAGTYFVTEFRYQDDLCGVYVNGQSKGRGSMQGGDLVTPWFFVQSRAGTASRILTVDYMYCLGPNASAAPW